MKKAQLVMLLLVLTSGLQVVSGQCTSLDCGSGENGNQPRHIINLQSKVQQLERSLHLMTDKLLKMEKSVYIRWGRTVCEGDAKVLYQGIVGAPHNYDQGGSAEYLCFPTSPEWGRYSEGFQTGSFMTGVEYGYLREGYEYFPFLNTNANVNHFYNHDVPCAMCEASGVSISRLFPALMECPSGWKKEYNGYLMTMLNSQYRMTPICVDEAPEVIEGSGEDTQGGPLWPIEAKCKSRACEKYVDGREITCVVCSG